MNIALAVIGISLSLPAQAATKGDPQSAYEPRSAPGAGQAYLARFVGDWDVAKTFHPRSGEPVKSTGRCRQTMAHGGRFLRSEFTFAQPGGPDSTGEGLIGFEPATGVFTSVWTDSRQTAMSLRRSRTPFDGKAITLESASLDPSAPPARRSRTVSTIDDANAKIVHRQFAIDAQGGERLMMELVMTRRATATPTAAPAPAPAAR